MAATFEIIASYTVTGSSTNTITFNSIPNTYGHLILHISTRANYSGNYHLNNFVQINSQSTVSSYVGRFAYPSIGTPTSISSQASSPTAIWTGSANSNTAGYFSNNWSLIGNYNSGDRKICRPYIGANESEPNSLIIWGGAYQPTAAAVTSLTLKEVSGNNYVADSTFYLYGLKNS